MKQLVLAVVFCVFSGCASMQDNDGPINSVCPVSGEMLGDAPTIKMVGDTKIGLCCKKCAAKFDSMTMEEQRRMIAELMPK